MATTPAVWNTTETGVRTDGLRRLLWSPYEDGDSLVDVQVRISTNAGMTAIVWGGEGLRAIDNVTLGDGWADIEVSHIPLDPSTQHWWDVRIRDDAPSTSSFATAGTWTTDARLTTAQWAARQ